MDFQKSTFQEIARATAQLKFQLVDLEAKSVPHFSSSKTLHKSFLSNFVCALLEGDAVGSTKCLCTTVLLQNSTRVTKFIRETRMRSALERGCFKGGSKNHLCKEPITH